MSYFTNLWRALSNRQSLAVQRASGSSSWLLNMRPFGNESIAISKSQALQVPAVTACIDVIAESISMLPLRLHRPDGQGSVVQQRTGQAKVINHLWSNRWTRATGMRFVIQQALKHGSGFVAVRRNRNNQVESLNPLPSEYVQVARQNGELWYEYRDPFETRQSAVRFASEDVLDFVFQYKEDGFGRLSKLEQAQQVISRYALQARSARRFFATGAPPHVIRFPPFTSGDVISDEAQAVARDNIVEGVRLANEKGNQFMFLEHGTEIQQIGVDPDKSQFIDQQLAMTQQIARVFSVPPAMVGDLSKGTYNNTEQSASFLLKHTLQPLMVTIQQEFNKKLFGGQRGEQSFVEFDDSRFLRSDMKSRAEVCAKLVMAGVYSQNDARELMGKPPLVGDEFDTPRQQAQMIPATSNEGEGDGADNGNE